MRRWHWTSSSRTGGRKYAIQLVSRSESKADWALQDHHIQNGPHFSVLQGPLSGGYTMALALQAAYKTVPAGFNVHHLVCQFFNPGDPNTPFTFDVTRTDDRKNNVSRLVSTVQNGVRLSMVTMDFIRAPVLDKLYLDYQASFPKRIESPKPGIDDLKFVSQGLLQSQGIGRVMGEF